MTEKISKINIESNDPELVVDINKKAPTVIFITVGVSIVLVQAVYLLFMIW